MNRMPSSSAVDIAKSMKLSYVFDCFQDIAGLHAENLGAGIDHIKAEFGVAWILMRMRIEIERYAHLEEPLVVETWPQPPKTLYDRDYIIRAEGSGEILARSVSTWVLMDLAAHDIAKGRVFDYTYPIENTERAIDCKLRQLKAPDAPVKVADHAVRYSDIDYNLHVNNARYIDLIMDTYSLEFHQAHEVAAIEVNYINEIRPDETLVIAKAAYPDSDLKEYIELSSATDGRVAIKAAIKFRKRK
ncbi:MAG: acyl-ACP thioesterase [Clostridiales Family XIII bacterium]|nr:acyl-ACP thioesterase [Clostridiales Family XIII bacterium]